MKNIIRKILKESDLDWIKDVSDEVPDWNERVKLPIQDLLFDYMLENNGLFNYLYTEDQYIPTEEYIIRFTPEEWDDYGADQWKNGDWREHGKWNSTPNLSDWSILYPLFSQNTKWRYIKQENVDWDLDDQSFTERFIWQRKNDDRYFGATVYGTSYDGWEDGDAHLTEIFQKQVIIFV